ncbi:MAG TPA: PD-(D/E)XK nuclease-like domain-containing protein, partial [Terriglobales bacterium]|nr:PD-(D/E)XK nuclease-like domain-containing protein [Terriglobales bacterium]
MAIIHGMSNAEYHSQPSVSSSQLKTILRSPAHYAYAYLSGIPQKEPTPSMVLGTLTHSCYLEPQRYEQDYIVAPEVDRRTKEGKAAYAEFQAMANGRTIVTEEQAALAEAMAASLRKHDVEMLIRDGGHVESSIFYTDTETGHACRIRPDWHLPPCADWPTGIIVDLKTTDDARPEAFARTCVS